MHAWVEVAVPTDGTSTAFIWEGFDPTRGQEIDESFVAVAVGRDDQEARTFGGVFSGDTHAQLFERAYAWTLVS